MLARDIDIKEYTCICERPWKNYQKDPLFAGNEGLKIIWWLKIEWLWAIYTWNIWSKMKFLSAKAWENRVLGVFC